MTGIFDVIVIGGGPAGLSAALNTKLEGFSTLLIEKATFGGRAAQSARIDNVLARVASGPEFAALALEHCGEHGVEFLYADVNQVRPGGMVLTSKGNRFGKAIVIATGLQWKELDIPGVPQAIAAGVARYGCDALHDKRVRGAEIAVLGGANSAGINALHFARECGAASVALLARNDLSKMSHYLQKLVLAQHNIWPLVGQSPMSVRIIPGGLAIEMENQPGVIEVQQLYLFPDALPRTDFVRVMKDAKGFLLTDENLMTSSAGIFAAGDVRAGSVKRIASAMGDGATVAARVKTFLEAQSCASCAA